MIWNKKTSFFCNAPRKLSELSDLAVAMRSMCSENVPVDNYKLSKPQIYPIFLYGDFLNSVHVLKTYSFKRNVGLKLKMVS